MRTGSAGVRTTKNAFEGLLVLMLFGTATALSWEEFVRMPIEEKYLYQYERLKQIENGSFQNQYLTKAEAASWKASMAIQANLLRANFPMAMVHVNKYLSTVKMQLPIKPAPTKFIKVGGVYVSEEICKANPSECYIAPVVQNQTQNKTINKRTPAECSAARQKDWELYCYQMANSPDKVDCDYIAKYNPQGMAGVLDNMAALPNTNQGICLRGG